MNANLLALAAIALWITLAWLGVRLASIPPFMLVGSALTLAGLIAAPLFLRDARLTRWHVLGALLGFAGAIVGITNGRLPAWDAHDASNPSNRVAWGYASALVSAFIWAIYSLMGQRMRQRLRAQPLRFPTAAIGLFCLVAGVLALACHALLEAPYRYVVSDAWPLAALAIGPMGAAFFLWDAALRRGDARAIGLLAYLTPLISTCLLGLDDPSRFGWPIVIALALVAGGPAVGALPAARLRINR